MRISIVQYLLVVLCSSGQASVTFIFDENFEDCGNGLPMISINMSNVDFLPQDDGSMVVNGVAVFMDDFEGPIRWHMTSQRLLRGQWVPGMISKDDPDFCPLINRPSTLWYSFTKQLEKAECPYMKGYEEHMDMINLGIPGQVLYLPPQFIGDWRVFHELTITRRGQKVKECFMVPFSILEV